MELNYQNGLRNCNCDLGVQIKYLKGDLHVNRNGTFAEFVVTV